MTIPITPGPFSFLQGAGEALGAYGAEKEKRREQTVKEAQDVLNQMIKLRQLEFIGPEQFGSPQAMNVYRTLGIMPPEGPPQATVGELTHGGQAQYIQQILPSLRAPGGPPEETRLALNLPGKGAEEAAQARIAQNVAAVPQAQVAGATAQGQLPSAGVSAMAGQQQDQDKQYNDMADRMVYAMMTREGRLPKNGEEAYALAQGDPRFTPFKDAITQPYFDAAIERLRQKQFALETERTGANARYAGATGMGADDLYRIAQGNQTRITAEMNSLKDPDKPPDLDFTKYDLVQQMIAKRQTVPAMYQEPYKRVVEYQRKLAATNKRRQELEMEMQQTRNQLNSALQQHPDISKLGGAPPPPPGDSPQRRAAAIEFERRTRGITDPAQRQRIAQELKRQYGVQ
jgi:hypothetical protein